MKDAPSLNYGLTKSQLDISLNVVNKNAKFKDPSWSSYFIRDG